MTDLKYSITFAPRAETKVYEEKALTEQQLIKLLSIHNPRKDKDGMCFLPGRLVGGKRAATSVPEVNCLVYDIDGTNSVKEVEDILAKAGLKAVLYTTFNHGRTSTTVKTDAYDKWAKRAGAKTTPDLESMLEYLKATKKGHLTDVKFTGETAHTGNGIVYLIEHAPEDKLRVVFPLGDKPIVLAKLSKLTSVAVETYKAIYHGVGESLELKYDEACSDPSRLHYMPGHLVGTNTHFVRFYDGPLLDYTNYPRSQRSSTDKKVNADGTVTKKSPTDYIVYDKNGRRIDIPVWDRKNKDTFDIEGMLHNCLPEDHIRGPRSGGKEGIHIQCPFEEDHTEPGGLGTFAVTGDGEERPWTIYCQHNSCQNLSNYRRLDFLKKLILDGYVTADDLGLPKPQELDAPAHIDIPVNEAAQGMGIDPDTIPDFDLKLTELHSIQDKAEALTKLEEQLLEARFAQHLVDFTKSVTSNGIVIDPEHMAAMCAASKADISSVAEFARQMPEVVLVSAGEFGKMVAKLRDFDFARAIGDLLTEQIVGRERDAALRKIAAYYGRTHVQTERAFKEQSDYLAAATHAELVVKHMNFLTSLFAKVQNGTTTMFLDLEESRKAGVPKMLSKESMALRYSNWTVEAYKKDPRTGKDRLQTELMFNVWNTRCRDIKMYRGVTFDPGQPNEETDDGMFNMWSGFRMQPLEGDASPILDHLKNIWCEGDERNFNWLQLYIWDIFTNPGLKPHSSVVILGGQGTGKSIVFEHGLRHMLSPYYVQSASPNDLTGNFNGLAENKLVFYADEALFAGNKGQAAYLKGKVAQETLRIERKGIDTYMVPHFTRYFFTSNSEHALHLDSDDRRFFVIRTSDAQKQKTAYFENLREWLTEKNGCRFWLHHIKNWKPEDHGLTRSDLFNPPSTEAKRGQIGQSIDPASEFFLEFIKYGRLTSVGDSVPLPVTLSWGLDAEFVVKNESLKAAFEVYLKFIAGGSARFERSKYTELFKKYFGRLPSDMSRTIRSENKTVKALVLPTRREVITKLHSLRIIDEADYLEALDNVDTHIPPYDRDDI